MEPINVKRINENVYLFNDYVGATCYLVVGSRRALVIDTMNGYIDIDQMVRSITELPYDVVNTHGHGDHIGGNIFVKEAYISQEDLELAEFVMNQIVNLDEVKNSGLKSPEWKSIADGHIFDLGDRTLEVYPLGGHTRGCICLLDRKDRILFTGDGIVSHLWMQLVHSLPMREMYENLLKLKEIRGEYDMILNGHCDAPDPACMYDALVQGVAQVLAGETQNDIAYEWREGVAKAHLYDKDQPEWRIVYK